MIHVFTFRPNEMTEVLSGPVPRLALAAFLGGLIGLERQLKHRPAGLRTNMFICFGAAMYTILSIELTKDMGPGDHTRIAAQIIPGIGFIGAGSILHAKNGVSGLTTAATLFVVASIGMACGGGLYLPALFATLLIFIGLFVLGWVETQFNLKPLVMNYSLVSSKPPDGLVPEVKMLVQLENKTAQDVQVATFRGNQRITFSVEGTRKEHKHLMKTFHDLEDFRGMQTMEGLETGE